MKKITIDIDEKNKKNAKDPKSIRICIQNTSYNSIKIVSSDKLKWMLTNNTKLDRWDIMWQDFHITPQQLTKMQSY